MRVTNNSSSGIVLPNGVEVGAGKSVEVEAAAWGEMLLHPVIGHYAKTGALVKATEADGEPVAPPKAKPKATEKGAKTRNAGPPPDPGSTEPDVDELLG